MREWKAWISTLAPPLTSSELCLWSISALEFSLVSSVHLGDCVSQGGVKIIKSNDARKMLGVLPTAWGVFVLRATISLIVVIVLVSSFVCVRIQINSHQLVRRDGPMDSSACYISIKTCVAHTPAPVFKLNTPINLVLHRVKTGRSVGLAGCQLSSSSCRDPVSREYIRE